MKKRILSLLLSVSMLANFSFFALSASADSDNIEEQAELYAETNVRFVNAVEGRAEGMILHYEVCGNHDSVGGEKKLTVR